MMGSTFDPTDEKKEAGKKVLCTIEVYTSCVKLYPQQQETNQTKNAQPNSVEIAQVLEPG